MRLQTIHFPCLTAVHLLTYSLTGPLWTIYLSSTCSARRAERYKRQSIWRAQKPNQEGRTQLELCLCVKLLFSSSCHRGSPTSKPREESVRRHMWETPGQLNCSGDTQLLPIVSVCWTATSIPTGDKVGFPGILLVLGREGSSKAGIPITPGRMGGISPGRREQDRSRGSNSVHWHEGGNMPHTWLSMRILIESGFSFFAWSGSCPFVFCLSVQSNCLGLPTLLTAKRLSFLPRFCMCEKKTKSKVSRKSEHRYISPEHGRCSYLTPQHSFFF